MNLEFEIVNEKTGEVIAEVTAKSFADADVVAEGFALRIPQGVTQVMVTTETKFEIVNRHTGERIAILGADADVCITDDDFRIQMMKEE